MKKLSTTEAGLNKNLDHKKKHVLKLKYQS